ncbi:MAG TPA: MerR family transcriptional regulator [Candidatus Eisenbacteria bacterium]|nr:MerR family transcriptional regulator [Candidatus Eisenbacteria bacterium]
MKPEELARELGVSGKTLRQWLREEFPRPKGERGKHWDLADEQVAAARRRFGQRFQRANSREGMVTTTLAVPDDLHERLRATAERSRRAVNDVVREAVAEWLSQNDREPSARPHLRLLQYSRRFLEAAEELARRGGDGYRFPVPQYLACHSIELALKAHLSHKGASGRTLRNRVGHDLEAALELSDQGVKDLLDKNHVAAIRVMNPEYSGKDLEYPPNSTGMRSAAPWPLLYGAASILNIALDGIFHREGRR